MRSIPKSELRIIAKKVWDGWLCSYSFPNARHLPKMIFELVKKERKCRKSTKLGERPKTRKLFKKSKKVIDS